MHNEFDGRSTHAGSSRLNKRLAALPLLAALCAGAQASSPLPEQAPPRFAQVIEREVPAIMKEAKIQGVAVGLIVDGKLVYARGFGYADHAGKVPVT
ncbi:MAG: serine hydrolase, partial [Rudaea sp.]|nr:serine hydrolase [Rudaea sp.]